MKKIFMSLFIPLFSYGQGEFLSVCDRTLRVREVIMEKVAQMDPDVECSDDDVMPFFLAEINSLYG